MSAEDKPENEIAPASKDDQKAGGGSGAPGDKADDTPAAEPFAAKSDVSESTAPEKEAAKPGDEQEPFIDQPDFAESVLAGLESAGFVGSSPKKPGIRPPEAVNAALEDDAAADDDAGDEDGLLDDDDDPGIPSDRDILRATRAEDDLPAMDDDEDDAFEPHFDDRPDDPPVSSYLTSPDSDGPVGANQKHDALAAAVQSALLAVYGDGNYKDEDEAEGGDYNDYEDERSDHSSWSSDPASPPSYAHDEGPRPEDVILNYFSQSKTSSTNDTNQSSIEPRGFGALNYPPPQTPEPMTANPAYSQPQARPQFEIPPFTQSHSPVSPHAEPSHTARADQHPAPSFPVPAAASDAARAMEIRDSGRLLGAAGLGLIGGIAFAAVLAVFIINSYGPEESEGVVAEGAVEQPASLRTAAAQPEPKAEAEAEAETAQPDEAAENGGLPRITVADVAAVAGQTVPIEISIEPRPSNKNTLVSITGVPEGARLSSGVDAGNGNWLLPPKRLKNLTVTLPETLSGPMRLETQLLDSNVRTPLSEKVAFNIIVASPPAPATETASTGVSPQDAGASTAAPQPSALPAAASIAAQPVTAAAAATAQPSQGQGRAQIAALAAPEAGAQGMAEAEIQDLIREGNRLMRDGDILKAREFYERAAKTGHGEAALAMGRSFDPSYFERLKPKTGEPDPAKAFEWYREAMNAGLDRAAQVRIENLRQWLNR